MDVHGPCIFERITAHVVGIENIPDLVNLHTGDLDIIKAGKQKSKWQWTNINLGGET